MALFYENRLILGDGFLSSVQKHTNCMNQLTSTLILLLLALISNAQQGWEISSPKVDQFTGVVVANGRLGILPTDKPFQTKSIILNNVYEKESERGVSRIVSGMNFTNLDLKIDGVLITDNNIKDWQQTLNMKKAAFTTTFTFEDKAKVTYTTYALRNVQYSGYTNIEIEPLQDIAIEVTGKITTPNEFQKPKHTYEVLKDLETTMPILQSVGKTALGKHIVASSATFVWHHINSTREHQRPTVKHNFSDFENTLTFQEKLIKGKSYKFAWTGAECTTKNFDDPKTESERFVIFNLLTPVETVISNHEKAWAKLWEGDIIIEGDLQAQLDTRLALYHLYAFSRGDSDLSIAPMGLSSQNYNGHIFWDTELWMFPPMLLLNQDIARSYVNYRSDRIEKAKQKAINYGFRGAMFPWESDDTGEEATPSWALTGTFEHHITADVAIAFWNYYRVSKNKPWLLEKGYPMLKEIADYLVSRATKNNDGSYSILNVVGANEFAPNVDDNAFTNGSAIEALRYAIDCANELNMIPDSRWQEVADNIRILKMEDGTTKEHKDYNGEIIKQADVNLLSYPLNIITDIDDIKRDLKYYEPKISPIGPAMGLSIFAILYAQLGNADEAHRLFKKCYEPNKRPPFGALAEAANSNNPYFATGAGGMLQVILFGFGGLDITTQGVVQKNPILPKTWKSLTITGVGKDKKTFTVN